MTALFSLAPLLLAAKGCDALVGNDKKPCAGLAGTPCPEGEFCDFAADAACGAADQTGVCRPVPDTCTLEDVPVCGCDDRTYSNACLANRAGVSVASAGECGGGAQVCGGITGAACEAGEFCDFPADASCGFADATGTCAPVPQACDLILSPVCGCDGRTYSNACEANQAGVSVASDGECGGGGPVCGGLLGALCPREQFCNFPPDALCGAADATGICTARPTACEDLYDPVCGCDGSTYANACSAFSVDVSVAHEGECDSGGGRECGSIAGGGCPAGQFCNYPLDALCGAADGPGTCTPIPEACTTDDNPVCGCGGMTFSNACEAHRAQVSVAHAGPCP